METNGASLGILGTVVSEMKIKSKYLDIWNKDTTVLMYKTPLLAKMSISLWSVYVIFNWKKYIAIFYWSACFQ